MELDSNLSGPLLVGFPIGALQLDLRITSRGLHSSIGIADRRGLLTHLTHKGVFIDVGRVADAGADRLRQEVFTAYPRPAGDRSIVDAIVAHAIRSEACAPPGSLAFELLRQRRETDHA